MSTNIERAAEVRAAVVEAMQTSWDEFVGDTGCYPDCFRREGKLLYADFRIGNFATWVADRLLAAEGLLVTDEPCEMCPTCNGSGEQPTEWLTNKDCDDCNGTGQAPPTERPT